MQIKYTLLASEPIGADLYRTMYETNIPAKDNPAIENLLKLTKKDIFMNLGVDTVRALKDESFHMRYAMLRKSSLGISVPSDNYTLVIIERGLITRLPIEFRIQS